MEEFEACLCIECMVLGVAHSKSKLNVCNSQSESSSMPSIDDWVEKLNRVEPSMKEDDTEADTEEEVEDEETDADTEEDAESLDDESQTEDSEGGESSQGSDDEDDLEDEVVEEDSLETVNTQ